MMKATKLSAVVVAVAVLLAFCDAAVAGSPLRAQHALGTRHVLVLAVSFPDVPKVPSLGLMKQRMLDEPAEYYATQSYGKTQLQGEIKGWYQLPRPVADYKVAAENTQIDRHRVRRLVEDAFNAADKDVVFDRYEHVVIVVGVVTQPNVGYGSICQSANPGTLAPRGIRKGNAHMETITTRGGQRFSGGIVIMAQNAHLGHVVHDLAHALGGVVNGKRAVPDLYDTVLQSNVGPITAESPPRFTVFMGPWDVMSRHFIERQQPPPGMSSFTRLRMGWIESDQVTEVRPEDSRAVTLSPLADGKGMLAIRVPGRWGSHYLLENRQLRPGDSVLPATGLLILHVDESREDGDGIVRVVDANPKVADFGASAFGVHPGQTPSARLPGDTAVEVLWQREGDLTVMVTTAPRAPEIQAVAARIRETGRKLRELPESPAREQARADLAAAMDFLMQMKSADAGAKVDAIKLP
jgi:M6 family metalloprotease-like protein